MYKLQARKGKAVVIALIVVILIAAQMLNERGEMITNTAHAAADDYWRLEVSPDTAGSGPIFTDDLNSYVDWQLNTMKDYAYLTVAGLTGNNTVRLVGELLAPSTGTYQFFTSTNDNVKNVTKTDTVRLWVDGELLIDTVGSPVTGVIQGESIALVEDESYDIRLEFIANSGVIQSNLKLEWIKPGSFQTKQMKSVTAPVDVIPPSDVTTAASGAITDDSIELIWTAPGSDDFVLEGMGGLPWGTVSSYDIRYSTDEVINEAVWWANAQSVMTAVTPLNSGEQQDVVIEDLLPDTTYYIALKSEDAEGLESEISNVVQAATTGQGPVSDKIVLDPSMVYNETFPHVDDGVNGGSAAFLDEQAIAGDPLNGAGGVPTSSPHYGTSSFNHSEHSIIVDLGEDHQLDYIFLYYGGGYNSGELEVSRGEQFNWQQIYHESNLPGHRWREIDLRDDNVTTRYLNLQIDPVSTRRGVVEIVLYGAPLGTNQDPTPPAPAPHTAPWMDEFIGVNALRDDPHDIVEVAGNVREYHNWSLDTGSGTTGVIDTNFPNPYPNNINKWNPSYCCNGTMNYDEYFQTLDAAGITVFPAIQGSLGYLTENWGDKMVYPYGADPLLPQSYVAHADHMYQFAARYGSTVVPDVNLKLAPGQPRVSGLGYIEYFENGNEPNVYWGTRTEHFTPYEFAAMLSADYDGHEGTMGNTVGVKNADPNAKLVMAGTAGYGIEYIRLIHQWAQEHRTDGEFPADVLNVHTYANASGPDQSASLVGVSPEEYGLKEYMQEIADYRDRYLPGKELWLSEFGYDTHPNSPQRAPAIGSFSAQEVQAQWLVRSYLELAAAGVDKAQMYMVRDVNDGGGKFNTSGLVTMKGVWDKKISWYYVYTLKNRLANLRLQEEVDSGHPNVMIQAYENAASEIKAYVVWAPTSNETVVNNVELALPAGTTQADLVLLTDQSTEGTLSALTISGNNTVSIDVSERPLFVMLDGAGQ